MKFVKIAAVTVLVLFFYQVVTGFIVMDAATEGDLSKVSLWVGLGAPVDATDPDIGTTPLMFACEHGNYSVVKYLLDHGASVNKRDQQGLTALSYTNSDTDIGKLLLQHGATPDIGNAQSARQE